MKKIVCGFIFVMKVLNFFYFFVIVLNVCVFIYISIVLVIVEKWKIMSLIERFLIYYVKLYGYILYIFVLIKKKKIVVLF